VNGTNCQVRELPVMVIPGADQGVLSMNEGEALEFTCIHSREFHILFPVTDYSTRANYLSYKSK